MNSKSRRSKAKTVPPENKSPAKRFQWTIPKAKRFVYKNKAVTDSYYMLNSSIGNGPSATFGLGVRKIIYNVRGADSPPSTQYHIQSNVGRGGKKFSSVPRITIDTNSQAPGPGAYEIRSAIGRGKTCSFKGRSASICLTLETPSVGHYSPNFAQVLSNRFSTLTIASKGRTEAKKNLTPGPGTYNIPRKFDKFN